METVDIHLQRVYSATSKEELGQAYGQWAQLYDQQITELGWGAPREAAERLAKFADLQGRVLDIGAGTGQVGEELARAGFTQRSALDLSPEMLAIARDKGIYQDFVVADLEQPLPIADAAFAAIVGVGVFTQGHCGPGAFAELDRILAPQGHLAFSLRPDLADSMGFSAVCAEMVRLGRWRLREESPDLVGFGSVQTKPYRIWVYQKG